MLAGYLCTVALLLQKIQSTDDASLKEELLQIAQDSLDMALEYYDDEVLPHEDEDTEQVEELAGECEVRGYYRCETGTEECPPIKFADEPEEVEVD